MTRSSDDVSVFASPLKPLFISELNGQPQIMSGGSEQKLTTNDAHKYLKDVKEMFSDKQEKYLEFLDLMKDYKAQSVSWTPSFLLKRYVLTGIQSGPHEPNTGMLSTVKYWHNEMLNI